MDLRWITAWVDGQGWLDPTADALQPAVKKAFDALGPAPARRQELPARHVARASAPSRDDRHPARRLDRDALARRPVGSPRPLGCRPRRRREPVPRPRRRPGLGRHRVGRLERRRMRGRARRLGVAHAALNVGATLLFTASPSSRGRGSRGAGRGLALTGYLATIAAACLGGEPRLPRADRRGPQLGARAPGEIHGASPRRGPAGRQVESASCTRRRRCCSSGAATACYALAGTCAHLGGPLSEGKLEGDTVVCPWHASRFALESGEVVDGPPLSRSRAWKTRIRNGQTEVRT